MAKMKLNINYEIVIVIILIMIKCINLSNCVIKCIKNIISKDTVSSMDEYLLKTIIDEYIDNNYVSVSSILSINSLTVNCDNQVDNIINLKDVDIKPHRLIDHHNDYTLESNEYIFALCLKGKTTVKCNTSTKSISNAIKRGEAFVLNLKTKYTTVTHTKQLHLAVIMYRTTCPFVYYRNIVFSEDNCLYDIFSGYRFALFRLFDTNDTLLEDVIILNGTYYNSLSMKKSDIINIKTLLRKYNIQLNNTSIDYVPRNYHKDSKEAVELSLDNNTVMHISDGTYTRDIYSLLGTKYKLLFAYGVICYNPLTFYNIE
ncbi:SPV122 hypothetical protein [Swinepox virus]|uniref:Uncharacterized protein n=1 Tax=Swinepox virus (strain Swine/Nebraska/17077-99/1999) TaxID=300880 RepID=Q8V3H4_SWPV1|nr:hypothetical protein SWPVgp122 [Swinepox virus]AAL69861.1 SPV122 hypothetical protein [Swinepox virus]